MFDEKSSGQKSCETVSLQVYRMKFKCRFHRVLYKNEEVTPAKQQECLFYVFRKIVNVFEDDL